MANIFGFQLTRVKKDGQPVNGSNPPPQVDQSLRQQGMGFDRPFSPGRPLNPYDGYFTEPRAYNFQTGTNITGRPRAMSQVSFETLRAIFANYDVAKICLHHRIASFRSFDWSITPVPGESGDLTLAIVEARKRILKPDGKTPYKSFISKYLKDLLRYDAATLHRRRDMAGRVIGLEVVDGSSIAPLIDEYGRRPDAPAPAYIQYANGVPWDWLSENDLIYEPYWPTSDSPYGEAPLEGVLLNANTDMRFGQHLLEYWTEGSIPGGFMEAPEGMDSPAQIQDLQDSWDARLQADQAKKVGVEWVPHGANFREAKPGKFDEPLALWSMRKTCAAMGVVPQDLGLTADVNRATGEVQMDVQERIGDKPLAQHIDSILTAYLQDDCGLPVVMTTSLGAEKEDRLAEASAWKIYIESGVASADEARAELLGLPIDNERPVPRFIMDTKAGPIPLTSLFSIAGQIDPETAAPTEAQALVDEQYQGTPGTIAAKLPGGPEFKRAPINPDDPEHPENEHVQPETGTLTPQLSVVKDLNQSLTHAGLVVRAQDTGRVLMLQRSLDDSTAAGMWEFPGGGLEGEESAWEGACREWQEETGCKIPQGEHVGSWTLGIYKGFVFETPKEDDLDLSAGGVKNPDDNGPEVLAWFDPSTLQEMPALRPECLLADWDLIKGLSWARKSETAGITSSTGISGYDLVGTKPDEDEREEPADSEPSAVVKELRQWRDNARSRVKDGRRPKRWDFEAISPQRSEGIWSVLKSASTREEVNEAFTPRPLFRKAKAGPAGTPAQRERFERARDHYANLINLYSGLNARSIAEGWAKKSVQKAIAKKPETDAEVAAAADAYAQGLPVDSGLGDILPMIYADGYAIGAQGGLEALIGKLTDPRGILAEPIDWSKWTPGNPEAGALLEDGGLKDLLDAADVTIKNIDETTMGRIGSILAQGAKAGDSVDEIAGNLEEFFSSSYKREQIASTELNRAVSQASLDVYKLNGVAGKSWMLGPKPCEICEGNAGDGVIPLDADFSGGVSSPPQHPVCECDVIPETVLPE